MADKRSNFPFLPTKRDQIISLRAVSTRVPANVIGPLLLSVHLRKKKELSEALLLRNIDITFWVTEIGQSLK